MSSKQESTTSLISTSTTSSNWSTTTKSPQEQTSPEKPEPKETKSDETEDKNPMSDSKFADLAKKNGWASPTATRPSF